MKYAKGEPDEFSLTPICTPNVSELPVRSGRDCVEADTLHAKNVILGLKTPLVYECQDASLAQVGCVPHSATTAECCCNQVLAGSNGARRNCVFPGCDGSHLDPTRGAVLPCSLHFWDLFESRARPPAVVCTLWESVGGSPLLKRIHTLSVLESVVGLVACLAQPLSPTGNSYRSAIRIFTSVSCFLKNRLRTSRLISRHSSRLLSILVCCDACEASRPALPRHTRGV